MTRNVLATAAIALGALGPAVAAGSELQPRQAGTFELGSQTASVYYVANGETYEVVTTIAPSTGAGGVPIRFVGFLEPGERQLVSVGQFGTDGVPQTLQLVHQGEALSATLTGAATIAAH